MNVPLRRFLVPVQGGRVRKPDRSVLAAKGENVLFDTYWQRRLNHGDVEEGTDPEPAEAPFPDAAKSSARTGDDK